MIRIATAVLALVLPALTLPAPASVAAEPRSTAAATAPDVNGPIFFTSRGDIHRMAADGTARTRLTSEPGIESDPSLSPDGRFIVYTRERPTDRVDEIYRMNPDGSGAIRLAVGSGPNWSPDGDHILYTCSDGDPEICVMNLDGTGQLALTANDTSEIDASFSPDGRHIVFVSSVSAGRQAIFRMDVDGHNRTQLAVGEGPADKARVGWPSYSPDGQQIVFAHLNVETDLWRIERINADGTGRLALGNVGAWDPSYSPDGQYIVFVVRSFCEYPDPCAGSHWIGVMRSDGSNWNELWDAVTEWAPSWGAAYRPCKGLVPTVEGTSGNDVLVGTPGPDVIAGHFGDDVIDGRGGADVICGGFGTDTVTYATHEMDAVVDPGGSAGGDGSAEDGPVGARDSIHSDVEVLVGGYGDDTLTGGPGADLLTGGPGDDTLSGGAGNDTLTGSSGDDALLGGEGDDRLQGLSGLDTLAGGDGNDVLDGGNDADGLDGGPGVDTATYSGRTGGVVVTLGGVSGGDGNAVDGPLGHRDTVPASVEWLVGGRGDDHLVGSPADNRLTGGLGADRLRGVAGRDVLYAKDGLADVLIDCGDGTDRAVIDSGIDPTPISCP